MSRPTRTPAAGRAFAASASALLALTLLGGALGPDPGRPATVPPGPGAAGTGCAEPCPSRR